MNFESCRQGANDFLRQHRLLGEDLARKSRTFNDVLPAHKKVLAEEYHSDYQQPWPGCSSRDQWSAVNWENQIYVNSKDPSVVKSCSARKVETLAALMSHEIYHIKAGSNYCSNETRCLYDHEMMAHIYEKLVESHSKNRRLQKSEWKDLSNKVFQNYIVGSLNGTDEQKNRLHGLLEKSLRRRMDQNGVSRNITAKDIDLMVRAGQSHFVK